MVVMKVRFLLTNKKAAGGVVCPQSVLLYLLDFGKRVNIIAAFFPTIIAP
jgi:hypothetical protein